jgi:hypothetical protein
VQANNDTVATLDVSGSVNGTGTLTVGALNLGSGATFTPNLVLNGDVTKSGAIATTLGSPGKLGRGFEDILPSIAQLRRS